MLLPAQNEKDVREVPSEVRDGLNIIYVRYVFAMPFPNPSPVYVFLSG